jgi:hypothetical protein
MLDALPRNAEPRPSPCQRANSRSRILSYIFFKPCAKHPVFVTAVASPPSACNSGLYAYVWGDGEKNQVFKLKEERKREGDSDNLLREIPTLF